MNISFGLMDHTYYIRIQGHVSGLAYIIQTSHDFTPLIDHRQWILFLLSGRFQARKTRAFSSPQDFTDMVRPPNSRIAMLGAHRHHDPTCGHYRYGALCGRVSWCHSPASFPDGRMGPSNSAIVPNHFEEVKRILWIRIGSIVGTQKLSIITR